MLAFCSTRELHGPHNAGLAQDVCYGLKGFILVHSKPLGKRLALLLGLLSLGSEVLYLPGAKSDRKTASVAPTTFFQSLTLTPKYLNALRYRENSVLINWSGLGYF